MGRPRIGIASHVAAFAAGVAIATALAATAGPRDRAAARSERRFEQLDVFAQALSFIENNYVERVDSGELIAGAVHGMVDRLDAHSKYLSPERYRRTREDTEGAYSGIGITLEPARGLITEVLERSPAERAGLLAGDRIVAVDGTPIARWRGTLRGRTGTRVALDVRRDGWDEPRRFSLVRERVQIPAVDATALPGGIAYIRIRQFQHATAAEVRRAVSIARERGALRGIVLDLRGNPGGLFDESVRVADLFLDRGVIVKVQGRAGRVLEEHRAHRPGTLTGVPVAVVIDGDSASSAEIVAGALQDNRRAVIVGAASYGKGSVQSFLDLDDGSGLKLTTGRYLTPEGRSIEGTGIAPDVEVGGPVSARPQRDPQVVKASSILRGLQTAAVP